MTGKKFCWVYRQKSTGRLVTVRRPTLLAILPTYDVLMTKKSKVAYAIPEHEFLKEFEFVGKLK